MFKQNLFAQIIGITATLILVASIIQGGTGYFLAKNELVNSGKLDIMHLTETAIPFLEELNEQVVNGNLTLNEAQEKARIKLSGPKVEGDEKLFYDYSKSPFTYKETGYIFAYNSDSTVAVHPSLPIGKDMSSVKEKGGTSLIKNLIQASKYSTVSERFYEYEFPKPGQSKDSKKIAYTTYYEPWDWTLVTGAYEDEFYASVNSIGLITLITAILALSTGVLGIYFLLRKKLTALRVITTETTKVSNGDLAVDTISYESEDEVGRLAIAFNKMTTQLRELVQNVQALSKNTSHASHELSALTEETSASSEEVAKAMNEITQGAVTQSTDIETVNTGAETLKQTMEQLTEQNEKIIQLTDVSEKAVTNGQEQVLSLQQANTKSKQALGNVEATVQQLRSRVTEIAGIVSTIEKIAEQTNLLALNASIEAARAGEQGKGFAVVAEEVRKLADETNKATSEIQSMINTIEEKTKISVEEMTSTINYSKQLDSAVMDTEQEFRTISSSIRNIVQSVVYSSNSIKFADKSTHELFISIQNVSSVSQQTSAASEEVMASVDEQVRAIQNITKHTESLNDYSNELNQLLQKFKV